MPILPDVEREYSLNVGRVPDSSGVGLQAARYDAISKVSGQLGDLATNVARDLHVKASNIEVDQKLGKYKAASKQLYEATLNNPDLDFVNNSDTIEKSFLEQQKKVRDDIIGTSQSYLSKSRMEEKLAGADAEDAIVFLDIKERRINDSMELSREDVKRSFADTTTRMDADFNLIGGEWKSSVVRHSNIFRGYEKPIDTQRFKTDLADDGGLRAVSYMVHGNRTVEAATQFYGKHAATLSKVMHENFTNGRNVYTGIGIKDPSKEGIFNVYMEDGSKKEVKESSSNWKKGSYILEGYDKGKNLIIEDTPSEIEMLNNMSPSARNRAKDFLFEALGRKPKEDNSLWNRQLDNIREAAISGDASIQETIKSVTTLDRTLPMSVNDATTLDLVTTAANAVYMDRSIKAGKFLNIADLPQFEEDLKKSYPEYLKEIAKTGTVKNALTKLGKGNIDAGIAVVMNGALTRDNVDKMFKQNMAKNDKYRRDFQVDPIKTSLEINPLNVQENNLLISAFSKGGFLDLERAGDSNINSLNNLLLKRRSNARQSMGGISPVSEILTKEEATDFERIWNQASQDNGQVLKFVTALRRLDPDVANALVHQINKPELLIAPYLKNPVEIQDMALASKDYKYNVEKVKADDNKISGIKKEIIDNKVINSFSIALTRGDTTKGKAVNDAFVDSTLKLTMQYMARGVDKDEAIEQATKTIVTNNFDVVDANDAFFESRKNYVLLPKNSGIESGKLYENVMGVLKDEDTWLNNNNLIIPKSSLDANERSGGLAAKNLSKDIASTVSLRPSVNGKYVDVVYEDKSTGVKNIQSVLQRFPDGSIGPIRFSVDELRRLANKEVKTALTLDSFLPKTSEVTSTHRVSKWNNIKDIMSSTAESPISTYIHQPSDVAFKTMQYHEGSSINNYNTIVKDGKGGFNLYGGLKLSHLQETDIKVFKQTPKATLQEYAQLFGSVKNTSIADKYMKGTITATRLQLSKQLDFFHSLNEVSRDILTDLSFIRGTTGALSTGIQNALRDRDADKALKIISEDKEWKNEVMKSPKRKKWLMNKLQLLK
jgi:hypothetical protein